MIDDTECRQLWWQLVEEDIVVVFVDEVPVEFRRLVLEIELCSIDLRCGICALCMRCLGKRFISLKWYVDIVGGEPKQSFGNVDLCTCFDECRQPYDSIVISKVNDIHTDFFVCDFPKMKVTLATELHLGLEPFLPLRSSLSKDS